MYISLNIENDAITDWVVRHNGLQDAADITMEPWGVPSGGDWGLYRGGAIFIEGAEHITVQHNLLTRPSISNNRFQIITPSTLFFKMAQHLDLGCVLAPAPRVNTPRMAE